MSVREPVVAVPDDNNETVKGREMRTFETGATRDADVTKFDYEGFLSPFALERFGRYMHENRVQKDGNIRDSDNWQKGIPLDAYMKSLLRHVFELWAAHRNQSAGIVSGEFVVADRQQALCAILFNAQGYLHELVTQRRPSANMMNFPWGGR